LNILIEVNHPAHVHLFRHTAGLLEEKGHKVIWLFKDDPVVIALLSHYGFPAISLGKKGKGKAQKYLYQLSFLTRTIRIVRQHRIALGMGVSMTLPLVSRFTRMKCIGLDDDDMAVTPLFAKYANRAGAILTPAALAGEDRGPHHLTYSGYHELAYLHPNRFRPDPGVLKKLGLRENDRFFIVRFNAFRAHHDQGEAGIGESQRQELIRKLEAFGTVFVSEEDPRQKGASRIEPWEMHSLMAYATLFAGDSQTMTSEAAVLGTPALKCNTFAGRLSVPNELEKNYGLCYAFLPGDFQMMMAKIDELLARPDLKEEWQKRRQKMLSEKIDVAAFLAGFAETFHGDARARSGPGD
jgi:hypothetical protein